MDLGAVKLILGKADTLMKQYQDYQEPETRREFLGVFFQARARAYGADLLYDPLGDSQAPTLAGI